MLCMHEIKARFPLSENCPAPLDELHLNNVFESARLKTLHYVGDLSHIKPGMPGITISKFKHRHLASTGGGATWPPSSSEGEATI